MSALKVTSTKMKKEKVKGKGTYFSTNSTRFTSSSIEPPTSKKSSTIVVSTPFLAHDIRALDSSGENRVAAPEK